MTDIVNFVIKLFKDLDVRSRWVAIAFSLVALVLAVLGFEYVTGHFYYERLEKRVSLLRELQQIANAGIASNSELYSIYLSTVEELGARRAYQVTAPSLPSAESVTPWKAISGASVWLLILVIGMPSEIRREGRITGEVIAITAMLIIVAAVFAWVGTVIPTLYTPWVNYIGFPLVQFAFLFLFSRRAKSM